MGCAQTIDLKPPAHAHHPEKAIHLPDERCGSRDREVSLPSLKIRTGQFIQRIEEPIYNRYDILKELGFGSFGKVFLAEHRQTRVRRAIKEINKPRGKLQENNAQFANEVEILSHLDHPNILKLYEVYEDADHYYMVTEALSGGELFDFVTSSKRLSEPIAAQIMYQVLSAVSYCHQHNIVHRDLKPENLLLMNPPKAMEQMVVKVVDFGTSCLFDQNTKMGQRIGTAYYVAPEVLGMEYNEKCDVWSLGVILYILLGGYAPFAGRTDEEILTKVKSGVFNFNHQNWTEISLVAKDLISRMLHKDYTTRISATECLAHPWVQRFHSKEAIDASGVISSLNSLRSFHIEQRLKKSITAFIVSQLVTHEQTNQLTAAFKALDKNGDGRLSREELVAGYAQIMPEPQAIEEVETVMTAVDFDGNGFIDYSEFLTGSLNSQVLLSKVNLEAAFRAFDRDGNGKISLSELKAGLNLVEANDDAMWRELIGEADSNGDGEIDVREFSTLMLRASGQSRP